MPKLSAQEVAKQIGSKLKDRSTMLSPEQRHQLALAVEVCQILGLELTYINVGEVLELMNSAGIRDEQVADQYPKMLTENVLDGDGNVKAVKPVLDETGNPIIFNSEEDEHAYVAKHGAPEPVMDHSTDPNVPKQEIPKPIDKTPPPVPEAGSTSVS